MPDWDTRIRSLEAELAALRRELAGYNQRPAIIEFPPQNNGRHRGITAAPLNKGGSAAVTRYTAGTTTPSGDTDTVNNELANIGSGKVVYYEEDGENLYVYAAECPLT